MEQYSFAESEHYDLSGKVWAMCTDTIPGLSCLAFDEIARRRLSDIKQRPTGKAYIVMIGDVSQLGLFGVVPTQGHMRILDKIWLGPVSVVIPDAVLSSEPLKEKSGGVAFRLPDNHKLQQFCLHHGPVVTTSANISGQESLRSLDQVVDEFSRQLDFIINEIFPTGDSSSIIKLLR